MLFRTRFSFEVLSQADVDRILTTKEFVALKDAIHLHESKKPDYMPDYAIEIVMLTGMRVGELAALKWSCVDDDYIHIDYSEHRLDYKDKPSELIVGEPKTKKHRKIPLTNDMQLLFGRIRELSFPENADFVFSDKCGDRHTAQEIGLAAIRRCKEAGIENGTIHRIRRTVSSILNQNLPQKAVAEMLGHTETVNEMYYNYSIAENSEKANALNHLSGIINDSEAKKDFKNRVFKKSSKNNFQKNKKIAETLVEKGVSTRCLCLLHSLLHCSNHSSAGKTENPSNRNTDLSFSAQ